MNNKQKVFSLIGIIVLMLTFVVSTYAFFRPQGDITKSKNVSATSNTTDYLSFQISNDISFHVTQADLAEGGNNKSGDATATAVLTPNNKTGAGSMNYYLYLNLTGNGINYSSTNTNHDPELMVQVFNSNNELVPLSGLGVQKTIKGVTGYDITGRSGLIPLLDNHTIVAINSTPATESWRIVVTLINLDVDQQDNTNKEINGEIIIRKDQQIDVPRLAVIVPQQANNVTKGYVETVIEPSLVNEEEIYTIYTVGYITDDSINGTTYSIDINNMGIDFDMYELELVGTPEVMTTQADYTNYVAMKTSGLPLTSLSNGDTNSAEATATELYNYSLNSSELTINNVAINCNYNKCTAAISESFSNISGKSKHSTTNSNNEAINVLYNGIKFNLKKTNPNLKTLATLSCNGAIYNNYRGGNQFAIKSLTTNNLSCAYVNKQVNAPYLNDYLIKQCNGTTTMGTCSREEANSQGSGKLVYENGLRYEGVDPNNYVWFNNELWRIIGVFDSTSHGRSGENLVKLIRENSIGGYSWNGVSGYANDWPNSTLYKMLNGCYLYRKSGNEEINLPGLSGLCSSYIVNAYDINNDSAISGSGDFSGNGIETYYRNMIENVTWYLGGTNDSSGYSNTEQYYNYERNATAIYSGRSASVTAKIGLVYMSDYGYATLSSDCARTISLISYNDNYCANNNWLNGHNYEWSIVPNSFVSDEVFTIDSFGFSYKNEAYRGNDVRPVVYLSSQVYKISGSGSQDNPYVIGM